MATTSTESPISARVQDTHNGNGASQPSLNCLGTPVILRIIMEHLPNSQLLRVSLVNKLWNYEARSVLKNRGSLIATLKSNSPCRKLGAFASDLRQMNVVPFSLINIALEGWNGCEECQASSTGTLDPNYNIILERIPYKQLRCHWGTHWEAAKKCQALLLTRKILQDFDGDLEEFKLHLGDNCETFMEQVLGDCNFSKLRTLGLRTDTSPIIRDEDYTAMTKALLSRAPKLQEFREYSWVNLAENVLEGSSAVLITESAVSSQIR